MTTLIPDASLDGGDGGGTGAFPVVDPPGAELDLVVANNLTFFLMGNSTSQTVTIPGNATEPFPIGAEMEFLRSGPSGGSVTFVVTGAAVLESRDGLVSLNTLWSAGALKKTDTDEWVLWGDLA